jgi:transposase
MTQAAEALPDDPETLKAMLIAERLRAERLVAIIKALQRTALAPARRAYRKINCCWRSKTSSRARRRAAEAKSPTARAEGARKRRANRGALPAHLPRVETLVDVEDKTCPCCKEALHRIGEDVSERLDVVPAQFRVLVVRRPKYACRACESGVVQSPAPARLVEGGLPTEAMVVWECQEFRVRAGIMGTKEISHGPTQRACDS